MAIDRPDWSGGLPVPINGAGVPSTIAGLPAAPDADYAGIGAQAQSALQTGTGLAPELVREMHGTADGFDANLESLNHSADRILYEVAGNARDGRETFIACFDELSSSIQGKALRTLWKNPSISFLDLLDKLEPTLTLAEQHEAEKWVREWKLWRQCP